MITQQNLDTILSKGGNVVDAQGTKIGSIGQIYLDDHTGDPNWVTAKTGLFGTSESFVPLEGANADGKDVKVRYSKDQVKGAPRIEADGALSPQEEDTLYRHYGLAGGQQNTTPNTTTAPPVRGKGKTTTGYEPGFQHGDERIDRSGDGKTVGYDTSGPTTDEAMTRSEERLRVGTETREAGRVRLRKYVVTEHVTKTVPVRREEVRIEREPITDANRGNAMDGLVISEEEHEVILHEENVIIDKEAVPVERVRLNKETVQAQETVSGEVRKEQIEMLDADQPGKTDRR
ncbi:DUF2382 domain-containing protein [Arthrobacter zhaoguopingii]|uniref:DUF2382 domain-containing protein n=1 Tax=Arthrobacter zhaoguopingii TaxID=2681491 RepID=UPI001358CA03|nr:PRC and DUF2382 domain-containing protein [Arthrobacter zhaoguopingii]